jgi:hypothetical protein
MKIDKEFAVAIDDEMYMMKDIKEVHVKDGFISMTVHRYGRRTEINRMIEKVRFLTVPQEPKIDVEETRLWNICDDEYVSKKINCRLEDIKDALLEAIKTLKDEQSCDIKLDIEGEQFAKLLKKYNQKPETKTAKEDSEKVLREETGQEKASTWKGYYMCGDRGFFDPPKGSHPDDIEVVLPFDEARKTVDEFTEKWNKSMSAIQSDMTAIAEKFSEVFRKYNYTGGD